MSLFKAKEWWSSGTNVSEDVGDLFHSSSLHVAQLGPEGAGDFIIIGDTNGLIQIFKPQGSFRPTDVILEFSSNEPILQIETGKLIFGSESQHIAVLHPKSFSVFSLLMREGQAEYGDQNMLLEQYHHNLPRGAYCFIIGEFGGVKDKDFVCVQSLDGLLMFFEQEVATFSCFLPNTLLPGPLEYSHCTDSFITSSSNWMIESYSYHNLSQTAASIEGKSGTTKKASADWVFNIGENILHIQKIQTTNHSCSLVMFGERSMYCLLDNGILKFMKRLEFEPICYHAYLIGWYHESNARLMMMVVSETSTLLVYHETTLMWSCQLTFRPVCINRSFFPKLAGAFVMLTESGEVKCCYLGTEPELFTAPPLGSADIDFNTAQEDLARIQNVINNQHDISEINMTNSTAEKELPFYINVELQQKSTTIPQKIDDGDRMEDDSHSQNICHVEVALKPLNKNDIVLIQTTFFVNPPLICSNHNEITTDITEDIRIITDITATPEAPVSCLNILVVVLYTNTSGNIKVLKKEATIPFQFVCRPSRPIKESKYKITLTTDKNSVDLLELFNDFETSNFSDVGSSSNAIAFEYLSGNNHSATIISAKSSNRYRLQSEGIGLLGLTLTQLIARLKLYFTKKPQFRTEKKSININLFGGISDDIMQYMAQNVEHHVILRQNLTEAEMGLDILATQFVLVQKRLMTKFRERPPTSCAGVEFLLEDTHSKINQSVSIIQTHQSAILRCGIVLSSCLQLIFTLLQVIDSKNENFKLIEHALSSSALQQEDQLWEETASQAVVHLLRTVFAKTEKDQDKLVSYNQADGIKDFDVKRFNKHIRTLIERAISKYVKVEDPGGTQINPKDDITEDQQISVSEDAAAFEHRDQDLFKVPQGSLFGLKQEPILSVGMEKQNTKN